MAGVASATVPKNSRQTVRICAGMRCSTKRALVMMPSQPSCTPQAGQEFVGDVLAQAHFAEGAAGDVQLTAGHHGLAVVLELADAEAGDVDVVDLAVVVLQAFDELPLAVGVHHFPAGEVVQRGAP